MKFVGKRESMAEPPKKSAFLRFREKLSEY